MKLEKQLALIVIALIVFAYGAMWGTITHDPLTWARPALAALAGVFLAPGVLIFGGVGLAAGIDMAGAFDPVLIIGLSVTFWIAAGAGVRYWRYASYASAAD